MRNTTPNKPAAPNPAIVSRWHAGHHWRGVGEPGRSAESVRRGFAEFVALRCCRDLRFLMRQSWEDSSGIRLAPGRVCPERAAAGRLGPVDFRRVESDIWT